MSFPTYFEIERVGTLYVPEIRRAIDEGRAANLAPAIHDKFKIALILVDAQVDFVHADGSLSVPGAVDDTRRTIQWIYSNCGQVTKIFASLDTHVPNQIFYPTWWVDNEGKHPQPFAAITHAEVQGGTWTPTTDVEWSTNYVETLEELGKKTLIIWPYHTMLGTPGHSITPALYEAIVYHGAARSIDPMLISKGSIQKTEHYSILEPEVKVPDEPLGTVNLSLLETLSTFDLIYIAGQAKSHCVLETVSSLFRYFVNRQPDFIQRWRILMDCTSSVVHPEIDFDVIANNRFAEFASKGMKLVTSKDPIE